MVAGGRRVPLTFLSTRGGMRMKLPAARHERHALVLCSMAPVSSIPSQLSHLTIGNVRGSSLLPAGTLALYWFDAMDRRASLVHAPIPVTCTSRLP